MKKRERSPILRDRSPLVLWKTYEEGLLPTPNIRPLRSVIWVQHPVIELEHYVQLAKAQRDFSLLHESEPCQYEQGIFLKFQTGIYGEKIARISVDSDEALKGELQNDYSPRTREIYDMLQCQILHALQDACAGHQGRSRGKDHPRRNSSVDQDDSRKRAGTSFPRIRRFGPGRERGTEAAVRVAHPDSH